MCDPAGFQAKSIRASPRLGKGTIITGMPARRWRDCLTLDIGELVSIGTLAALSSSARADGAQGARGLARPVPVFARRWFDYPPLGHRHVPVS